ncbi:MAG: DUF2807 domain-containing protein [Pseudoruegeria sp.]
MFHFTTKSTALALILVTTLTASTALAETQSFDLSGFEGVSAAEGIRVQVLMGPTFEVIAENEDDRQLEYLSIDVTRGVLVVEMKNGLLAPNWVTGDKVEVRVVMPALVQTEAHSGARIGAEMMSGSDLDVTASSGASLVIDAVEAGAMHVDVASGATIEITNGSCASLSAEVSGGSFLDMENIICDDVNIDASSGSTASVHTEKSVDANASSGANIRVYGAPTETRTNTAGGGIVVMR